MHFMPLNAFAASRRRRPLKSTTQLLLVYAELRRALGDAVSAGDALDFAERLTDLANYRDVIDRRSTADFATPGCVPLDRAFYDGGWALLYDALASGLMCEDDPADNSRLPGHGAAQLTEHWA
jgi:hypothetical protein